ncbi:hypothetical protein AMTRI_Chr03g45570 [Amborella trichopoda]
MKIRKALIPDDISIEVWTAVRPALLCGAECWAVNKQHTHGISVAKMKMFRSISGMIRKDRLQNGYIQENLGITNDHKDPCVDTFQTNMLHILKHFGVPTGLELKIISLCLKVPIIQNSLSAVNLVDEGMVKRIRGIAYIIRVSPEMVHRMRYAACVIFNRLLSDVNIRDERFFGYRSLGYSVSLVADTASGCFILQKPQHKHLMRNLLQCFLRILASKPLLEEIKQGGVALLFLLRALCLQDISKVQLRKLSPYAIQTLRHIRDFLGVKFNIKPDPYTNSVVLTCLGCGLKNLFWKIS